MRVILPFVLNGQTLEKGNGFPQKIYSGSKDSLVIKVDGIPSNSTADAYFKLSWEKGKVYNKVFNGSECVIDEYVTTLPEQINEYVNYVVSVSVVIWDGSGERLATEPVCLILEKSNYSDATANTPELPESQYSEILDSISGIRKRLEDNSSFIHEVKDRHERDFQQFDMDMGDLSADVKKNANELDALSLKVQLMDDTHSQFNQELSEEVSFLKTSIQQIDLDLGDLSDDYASVKKRLDVSEQSIGDVVDLLNSVDADVSDHGNRIEALEKNGCDEGYTTEEIDDYALAISDEDGNIVAGIKPNGETVGNFPDNVAREKIKHIKTTDEYAYAVCDNNGNVVFAITEDGEVQYDGKGEGGASGGGLAGYFKYKWCGLPVLFLKEQEAGAHKEMIDAAKPANNYEKLEKAFEYTLRTAKGTVISSGTCDLKFQGSSSLRNQYPKYNYTLKANKGLDFEATGAWPKDEERVVEKFDRPWGAQRKYCMKANFIDPSGARNVASARLWASIVKSRSSSAVVDAADARLTASPNCGAVDGFPIIIELNGEFRGLYTFNIPKENWMFNGVNDEGDIKYIVGGESNDEAAAGFAALAEFPEGLAQNKTDFAIEYIPDEDDPAAKQVLIDSFNAAISAVRNAKTQLAQNPDYDWEAAVSPYFDIDSAIDYYIFACCISGSDNLRKNILYATYGSTEDGVPDKWFMSAYDLDTTFGSNPYGKGLYKVKTEYTQFKEAAGRHNLFYIIYHYAHDKLMARYDELRNGTKDEEGRVLDHGILSDENVWYVFNNFVNAIPKAVYNADADRWASADIVRTMPGTTTANVENYMQYYRMHCALLDKEIAKIKEELEV